MNEALIYSIALLIFSLNRLAIKNKNILKNSINSLLSDKNISDYDANGINTVYKILHYMIHN